MEIAEVKTITIKKTGTNQSDKNFNTFIFQFIFIKQSTTILSDS